MPITSFEILSVPVSDQERAKQAVGTLRHVLTAAAYAA
jgi:hypothetical protein